MSTKPNSGGAAYPRTVVGNAGQAYDVPSQDGMTLRQHYAGIFAAAIVSSIHSEADYQRLHDISRTVGLTVSLWIAREALKQADALIAMEGGA